MARVIVRAEWEIECRVAGGGKDFDLPTIFGREPDSLDLDGYHGSDLEWKRNFDGKKNEFWTTNLWYGEKAIRVDVVPTLETSQLLWRICCADDLAVTDGTLASFVKKKRFDFAEKACRFLEFYHLLRSSTLKE